MIAWFRKAGFSLSETAAMLVPSANASEGWRAAGIVAAERLRNEISEREQLLSRLNAMLATSPCYDPVECAVVVRV